MPRIGRIVLPQYPHHVVQRGHDRNEVFVEEMDYHYYLETLKEFKETFQVKVYAYCLMTNHIHLLLEPATRLGIGQLMKRLAGRQTRLRNRLENRRGTLWEGRYKSSVVDADEYLMACVRYIEMNPVRAGIVDKPHKYEWSSYRERTCKQAVDLLDELPFDYHEYEIFMNGSIPSGEWDLIRDSVQSNHITGSTLFCERIERAIGRRLNNRKPGRPRKN
ncbi:MAG: transposase [Candidatus Thiodiazotropha sp. (ex Myrtea spinifera)]|nr:transposase [Candidatus Thiodiazotropha sp. (ex Myrtea spinifera)]